MTLQRFLRDRDTGHTICLMDRPSIRCERALFCLIQIDIAMPFLPPRPHHVVPACAIYSCESFSHRWVPSTTS
jgi:hypothetical protein